MVNVLRNVQLEVIWTMPQGLVSSVGLAAKHASVLPHAHNVMIVLSLLSTECARKPALSVLIW